MKLPKFPKMFPLKRPPRRLNANAATRRAVQPVDDYGEEPQTKFSSAIVVVLILHLVFVGGIYAFNSIKAHRKLIEPGTSPVTVVPSVPAPGPGNAPVAAKPEAPERAVPAPVIASISPITGGSIYKVKAGDNLTKVALLHGVSVADLEEANSNVKNLASLKVGQVLNLPKAKPAAAARKGEETPKATAAAKKTEETPKAAPTPKKPEETPKVAATAKTPPKTYTVAKGDNPEAIARKLGVSYQALLKLNSIEDPKKLPIGQVLKVPVKKE